MRTATGDTPLVSGYKGPSASMPRGTPDMNGRIKSHVEAHAAAVMRERGIKDATLHINQVPCSSSTGCGAMLPRMLPEGARLRVLGPDGYDHVFIGLPD
ncbi:DddA-like double-stranded DNA deaminase toxin [Sorangium cellulosum]|uniref:DddA-like double-stranded DNA deaminase toxin n=1 Tax=Sorangium cellulosum TaxID=56 RepID=UPI001651568E